MTLENEGLLEHRIKEILRTLDVYDEKKRILKVLDEARVDFPKAKFPIIGNILGERDYDRAEIKAWFLKWFGDEKRTV